MKARNIFITLLYLSLVSVVVPFALGLLNWIHPLFDSFSHFRIHLLVVITIVVLLLLLLHKKIYRYIFGILLLASGTYLYMLNQPYAPKALSSSAVDTFTHMQFNLNFRNKRVGDLVAYWQKNSIDIVTLQEVTDAHRKVLEDIRELYPYQSHCEFCPVVGGVSILSKYPIVSSSALCLDKRGFVSAQITIDDKQINIASIHLHWPYPYGQYQQLETIKEELIRLGQHEVPTLISGDFNAAPWSHVVDTIAQYSNTSVLNGTRWTIDLGRQLPLVPNMKLPIDHLLLSKELTSQSIKVEKSIGSDHLPIVSKISFK